MTLSWVVWSTCLRDGMPSRESWTSWRSGPMWISWGSTRPNAGSCTWAGATPAISKGWETKRLRAALLRKIWRYWWTKSWIQATNVHLQPRRPTASWAASQAAWPAGRGRGCCSSAPLWWDLTWSPVSSSGTPSTGKTWMSWSKGGRQKWSEGWNAYPMRKVWETLVVQPGEEKAAGRPYSSLPVPEGALQERRRGTFHKGMQW